MLIEVSDKECITLLAALRCWSEEQYNKDGDCVCAPHEWFQGNQPLAKHEVEQLITEIENPGELRYLLYDIDQRTTARYTYASQELAKEDQHYMLPDVIIRPFLTGGPPTQEEEDADCS